MNKSKIKYLLDSHVIIWLTTDKNKLSKEVKNILENTDFDVYASSINFWEISLKSNLGKLALLGGTPEDLYDNLSEIGINTIQLDANTTKTFFKLNATYHRDPFDRMLIWQAISENYTLITCDENITKYKSEGLKILW